MIQQIKMHSNKMKKISNLNSILLILYLTFKITIKLYKKIYKKLIICSLQYYKKNINLIKINIKQNLIKTNMKKDSLKFKNLH